jgi:hypothetical protein
MKIESATTLPSSLNVIVGSSFAFIDWPTMVALIGQQSVQSVLFM